MDSLIKVLLAGLVFFSITCQAYSLDDDTYIDALVKDARSKNYTDQEIFEVILSVTTISVPEIYLCTKLPNLEGCK